MDDFRQELYRYGSLGIDLVANTLVGLVIGYLLDRWLGTMPWLMIAGLILGAAAGFFTIYRTIVQEEENQRHK